MAKRAELLSPAGSPEALRAAVANGADAVYLGYGDFNARRLAKNFSESELCEACAFCRKHGVKVYVTVNTLATDRELMKVERLAREISRAGADAAIVADLGVARLFREVVPELPLHASTQMTVHTLDGVRHLADLGFSRVVLARELSREDIFAIAKSSPIELEVFVHGALCMCWSGQCEMSAVIGTRSGNRGLCAQPCRLQYKLGETSNATYPLSLRDLCLADYITELSEAGIASLKIEGRMKRPEYVATVTGIYSKILREGRAATSAEKKTLEEIFSRDGFTDGYYKNEPGKQMFGIRTDVAVPQKLLESARSTYEKIPEPVRYVDFYCVVKKDTEAVLAVSDDAGNRYIAKGPVPEPARNVELSESVISAQLAKTGGTDFSARSINVKVDNGLSLPLSAINAMRRECLDALPEREMRIEKRREGEFNVGFKLVNRREKPRITVSVMKLSQISDELLDLSPEYIIIPVSEVCGNEERIREIASRVQVVAGFPRIMKDSEKKLIRPLAQSMRALGVSHAAVGNLGHLAFAEELGFTTRADLGINVFNSHALREVRRAGTVSALLSPELTFAQIRDVSKIIDTEIIVYGRLPLMVCENCVIKAQTGACVCKNPHFLIDRTGASFPIVPELCHRNVILNSKKIFLADKRTDYERIGVSFARLAFTTENARECVTIYSAYLGREPFSPHEFTRGLYYRGVE